MNDTASKTDSHPPEDPVSMPETGAETTAETVVEPTVEPSLEEQLEAARRETAAAKEAHLRAMADLDNFRRRTAREKDDLRAFAAASVVEELMPVLDNFGFALTAAKAPNAELKTLTEGVDMIASQLKTALGNHGLKEVNPAGAAFDPNLHEAVSQQPSDEVAEGQVLQVIRVGYTLNGRLLRPATVIVSGGPAAAETEA